jgi:hypothetical protein
MFLKEGGYGNTRVTIANLFFLRLELGELVDFFVTRGVVL